MLKCTGAYILSTLEEGSRDVNQNYGFVIVFSTRHQITRVTSYSLHNSVDSTGLNKYLTGVIQKVGTEETESTSLSRILSKAAEEATRDKSFVAFKALPVDVTSPYVQMGVEATGSEQIKVTDCRQAVDFIIRCILHVAQEQGKSNPLVLEHKDIVRCAL
jgi:hypothetical protein